MNEKNYKYIIIGCIVCVACFISGFINCKIIDRKGNQVNNTRIVELGEQLRELQDTNTKLKINNFRLLENSERATEIIDTIESEISGDIENLQSVIRRLQNIAAAIEEYQDSK